MAWLHARWCGYWFAPGGRISAAVLRIAVAVAMLWMLRQMSDNPGAASRFYYKHGLWLLYPGRPSAAVLAAVTAIAWGSTIALLVGLWTRWTHLASAITTAALAAYAVSDTAAWSHTDVPPVLATLALLGARCGDALSIDAWWRARRGRGHPPGDYQCAVRLVQFAVASVFVFAAYEKLRSGGWSLAWALSDNLRHQLLTRFDWSGVERTPMARWLLGAAWRYQLCACLNLVSQVSPVLAVIFVRRPWLRALAGAAWCTEVVGLGEVMGFWNPHWLPLGAAFVDWEALAGRLGVRCPADPPGRSRGRLWFATGFVVFFAVQALWLNERLQAYPFSRFALFAVVRAKRPYHLHQTYELPGGHLEALGAGAPSVDAWLARRGTYRWLWRERDPDALRQKLANVLGEARDAWPGEALTGARLWLSTFQAPAYPAPARLDRSDIAVLGELDGGVFRSAMGTLLPDGRTWIAPPCAPGLAGMQLFTVRDDLPAPTPVAATPTRTGFVLADPLRGDPIYLIGRAADHARPWLLAVRARRGY